MEFVIWHNPRCSKSRAALAILQGAGVALRVRRYLEDPPAAGEIGAVLQALGRTPLQLMRIKEPVAVQMGLATADLSESEWLQILSAHPQLIERPVVIASDGRAVLGRPPEAVRELL